MVKKPPANARDAGLIPGSGRSPREGNGNPLQDSCWENSRDRGAWWAIVRGVTKSRTQQQLHTRTHTPPKSCMFPKGRSCPVLARKEA